MTEGKGPLNGIRVIDHANGVIGNFHHYDTVPG